MNHSTPRPGQARFGKIWNPRPMPMSSTGQTKNQNPKFQPAKLPNRFSPLHDSTPYSPPWIKHPEENYASYFDELERDKSQKPPRNSPEPDDVLVNQSTKFREEDELEHDVFYRPHRNLGDLLPPPPPYRPTKVTDLDKTKTKALESTYLNMSKSSKSKGSTAMTNGIRRPPPPWVTHPERFAKPVPEDNFFEEAPPVKRDGLYCGFCKANGHPDSIYFSHDTTNGEGIVVCPYLRKVKCKTCGETGDKAHTRNFCKARDNRTLSDCHPPHPHVTGMLYVRNYFD